MFSFLLVSAALSISDRRLDPFQFNLCVWNLDGIDNDAIKRIVKNDKDDDEAKIARVMYTYLSTCDMFVLPGVVLNKTSEHLVKHMIDNRVTGFETYSVSEHRAVTLLSRIDVNDITDLGTIEFPIPNSKCVGQFEKEPTSLEGSFYGDVQFHDTVNATRIVSVSMSQDKSAKGCFIREAQATKLCDIVKSTPADHDIFIAGSFGAEASKEPFGQVLKECGLKAGSDLETKSAYTRASKTLIENVYVKGTASNWLDVITYKQNLVTKFHGQDEITYPLTLYVPQPLSKRWFKFEVTFSSIIMTISVGFFTWLLFYSRIRPGTQGGYEAIGK